MGLEIETILKEAADWDVPVEEALPRLAQRFNEDADAVRQGLAAIDEGHVNNLIFRAEFYIPFHASDHVASDHISVMEALADSGVDNVIDALINLFPLIATSPALIGAIERGVCRAGREAELVEPVEKWARSHFKEGDIERMSKLDPREPERGVSELAQDVGRCIAALSSKPLQRAALKAAKQAISGLRNSNYLEDSLKNGMRHPEVDPRSGAIA